LQSLGALDGDRYTFRENTREIIGELWGRKFRIGQPVRVLLDRVDAMEKRLQFSILLEEDGMVEETRKPKKKKVTGARKEEAAPAAGAVDEAAEARRPAKSANPAKSARKKKRFRPEDVPAFAARVAKPAPRGHKKGKKKSMQQSTQKPKGFGGKKGK
jgi:ribonuclease R